ncbi:MAG: peptidoglycan bridge formation glycyltransferase FemA/FemB family protein [Patescibacteria group bacterium]
MIEVKNVTRKQLEGLLKKFPEANFLQSWQWGEFQLSLDKQIIRRCVPKKALYTAVVESARRGRYMTIAGGPLMDYSDDELVDAIVSDIAEQAVEHKCDFVRVRPQIEDSEQSRRVLKELGLRPAPMPLSVEHAGIIDLGKSEDEVMAGMSQSLRRKIRKAQKLDIDIEVSQSPSTVDSFYEIHAAHAARMKYVPFSKKFLTKQFEAFAATDNILMYTARHDGEIVAQNFVIFYGTEASYHYGVSTAEGVKLSSAPLLHLAAMGDARARGCSRYNFWGIVDEEDTSHRYFGVSQFKRSFGVDELKHVPAHDLVIRGSRYVPNWLLETARRKKRRL